MEEPVAIFWTSFLWNAADRGRVIERGTVDDKDVQAPVVVVVEKCDTGTHRFDEVFLGRVGCLVFELHPKGGRYIGELTCQLIRIRIPWVLSMGDWGKQ